MTLHVIIWIISLNWKHWNLIIRHDDYFQIFKPENNLLMFGLIFEYADLIVFRQKLANFYVNQLGFLSTYPGNCCAWNSCFGTSKVLCPAPQNQLMTQVSLKISTAVDKLFLWFRFSSNVYMWEPITDNADYLNNWISFAQKDSNL